MNGVCQRFNWGNKISLLPIKSLRFAALRWQCLLHAVQSFLQPNFTTNRAWLSPHPTIHILMSLDSSLRLLPPSIHLSLLGVFRYNLLFHALFTALLYLELPQTVLCRNVMANRCLEGHATNQASASLSSFMHCVRAIWDEKLQHGTSRELCKEVCVLAFINALNGMETRISTLGYIRGFLW